VRVNTAILRTHAGPPRHSFTDPAEDTLTLSPLAVALAVALAALLVPAGPVHAQPAPRPFRVGVLNEAWAANHPTVEGLKVGLRELGLVEGRDVAFDIRFTEGKPGATPAAARALVKAGVDLIFTSNEAATTAARDATREIPIVFTLVGDPITSGIVASLARPGGNLTGISNLSTELTPKRLEVLKTIAPGLRRVWFVYYGGDVTDSAALAKTLEASARLKVTVVPRTVKDGPELIQVLAGLQAGDGLLAPFIDTLDIPATMLETSLAGRIPAVFPTALWVGHGGLVSYGPDFHAQGIQAARLVAKILKGARPRDLPVEGAEKIDLAVNLKTASLLGIPVPRKILLRADGVYR
jgi:putative ABC transport system substrate-binding protein